MDKGWFAMLGEDETSESDIPRRYDARTFGWQRDPLKLVSRIIKSGA